MARGFRCGVLKVRVYEGQEDDFTRFLLEPSRFVLEPTGYRDGVDGEFVFARAEEDPGG